MTTARNQGKATVHPERRDRVVRSALWAAWADSLGFISELTDERGLLRRLGENGPDLSRPVAWRRRVGGRYGVEIDLPAGCYSDDTQLRLAVGRAITDAGFDVEAFARVELPVWPSYALGGGRSSKAAAANMAKPNTAWFANFYSGWTDAGGNGAAMRIQPHIWSAARPSGMGEHLLGVFTDAVTTHAHPRALFGAILHATALGETLASGAVPGPDRWEHLFAIANSALSVLDGHAEVDGFWRPSWEKQLGISLKKAWANVSDECERLLALAADVIPIAGSVKEQSADTLLPLAEGYRRLIHQFGLDSDEYRGSGLHTVVAALALSSSVGSDARTASVVASGEIGTDTDTIATMAAAVCGAADGAEPAPDVLDGAYIVAEAARLASIAEGERTQRFAYPDLLTWVAPRTQSDACGLADERPALAGLGWCEPLSSEQPVEFRDSIWQWMRTDFGQTILLKQRSKLRALPKGAWPATRSVIDSSAQHTVGDYASETHSSSDGSAFVDRRRPSQRGERLEQLALDDTNGMSAPITSRLEAELRHERTIPAITFDRAHNEGMDVDRILAWVSSRHFSDYALGYALRRLAEDGSIEQVIAFSVAVHAATQRSY
ncbi:ADP-ribosylglycohydrolase [Mycobacterium marinum]|uniref:ADP-ribosylglycohydrolase family protein n=1 Tax=Mycobacterium marinum TaxID=1781 RepID=UPI000E3E8A1B|nr:ADP-ribosylglycohydrolase family protein [Mycobacterium marinum]RFZ61411.1 ADP-ribosylglycohydrolase [Mycobacterium marinum]